MKDLLVKSLVFVCLLILGQGLAGCGWDRLGTYSDQWLYPEGVSSVYVEMFDNRTFRRGIEYELTDAVAKRIEVETPYKIVSDRDKADTVITGQIVSIGEAVLTGERNTGRPLEKEAQVQAIVSWKDMKTGRLLVDSAAVSASASFSNWQGQSFGYASAVASNRLAERIVELMQKSW